MGLQSFKEIQTNFEFIEKEAQNKCKILLWAKNHGIFLFTGPKKTPKMGSKSRICGKTLQLAGSKRGPRNAFRNGPRYTIVPTISRHRASHCNSLGRSDQRKRCLRKKTENDKLEKNEASFKKKHNRSGKFLRWWEISGFLFHEDKLKLSLCWLFVDCYQHFSFETTLLNGSFH